MKTSQEKSELKIQREQYRTKISALKDTIKGKDEKIAQLEAKVAEQETLLQKDHYKERNKNLTEQVESLMRQLQEKQIVRV